MAQDTENAVQESTTPPTPTALTVVPDAGSDLQIHERGLTLWTKLLKKQPYEKSILNQGNATALYQEFNKMHKRLYLKLTEDLDVTNEHIFQISIIEKLESLEQLLVDTHRKPKLVVNDITTTFRVLKESLKNIMDQQSNIEDQDYDEVPEEIDGKKITTEDYLYHLVNEMNKKAGKLKEYEKMMHRTKGLDFKLTSKRCEVGSKLLPNDRLMNCYMKCLDRYEWLEKEYDRVSVKLEKHSKSPEKDTTKEEASSTNINIETYNGSISLPEIKKISRAAPEEATSSLINLVKSHLVKFREMKSSDPDPTYNEFLDIFSKSVTTISPEIEDEDDKMAFEHMNVAKWSRTVYDAFIQQVKIAREKLSSKQLHELCQDNLKDSRREEFTQMKSDLHETHLKQNTAIDQLEQGDTQEELYNSVPNLNTDSSSDNETNAVSDAEDSIHSSEARSEDELEHDDTLDFTDTHSENDTLSPCPSDNKPENTTTNPQQPELKRQKLSDVISIESSEKLDTKASSSTHKPSKPSSDVILIDSD